MKLAATIIILIASTIFAQVEQTGKRADAYPFVPNFYMDVADYKSEKEGMTKVDVYLQVPYGSIQFIKSGDAYVSKYSVTLTFLDDDEEKVIMERLWNEKIEVKEFDRTTSKSSYNLSFRSFDLKPGEFHLRCRVEDLDSKKNVTMETNTIVSEFSDSIDISDLMFIAKVVKEKTEDKIFLNVSKLVTNRDEGISFFYEIYANADKELLIEYSINDNKNNTIYTQLVSQTVKEGSNRIVYTIENPEFKLGEYDLIIKLKNEEGDEIKGIGKKFFSKIYGFPDEIKNLDKAVDQMIYIATQTEMDYLNDAKSFDEKLNRYIDYWKAKDPSLNTIENEILLEYYRRIGYANSNFATYNEGWRTDMGMIYITLGPPNQVDRHPFEYDSKPYEVWDYYELNRRFVFMDQTGFGEYRLVNPQYGEWNRYRY